MEHRTSPTFRGALADWTDIDYASFHLARAINFIASETFIQSKHLFWTDNPVGNALVAMLNELVRAGILESREEPDWQFRWKTDRLGS